MAVNIWNWKCSDYCRAPCARGCKKCAKLCPETDNQYKSVQTSESDKDIFHHKRYENVNRPTAISELNKYTPRCTTCRCIIKQVKNLLDELDVADLKDAFIICEHCHRSAGIPCKRCEYVARKFWCCGNQAEDRLRRFSEWISKIKELLLSILDTCHGNRYLVTNEDDRRELERLLREIYPADTCRCTPRIDDWTDTSKSLSKIFENKEILRKILERMKGVTCSETCPCRVVDTRLSQLSIVPSDHILPPVPLKKPTKKPVKKIPPKRYSGEGKKKTEERHKDSSIREQKQPPVSIRGFFYQLSDKKFIDNGWTRLPILETKQVYHVYKMTPVKGQDDWITLNKDKGLMYYDSGEILAVFKKNGAVTWYYKNGMVALVYNGPEEANDSRAGMYVLYSYEMDTRKKQLILARFDYQGNGAVYDDQGNERLKYNQNSGELFDKKLGPPTKWLWHDLNEPPEYEAKFFDTFEKNPDPKIQKLMEHNEITDKKGKQPDEVEEERMREIEQKNEVKQKERLLRKTHFETYKIMMKTMKINEYFSLKVMHQTQITLRFNDAANWLKLDLGLKIHSDQYLGKSSELVLSEPTPKICRPNWSWSLIPEPSIGTRDIDDMSDYFK